ncbi:SusC/RagA family TonB-linked outer membrane protein [Segatella paludivivens]|uniref:SusC/RagA family TonB-linked outer membrane protein n=1 Tax=Segatella paludivivens TaxID=185294 RepID=UPI00036DC24D|nr:SusC/RagA family TonB-linked outer membrane protein [Segatella paludivivens]
MEKRLLVFLACMFLSLGMALAQIRVSGTVTSSDDGEPITGASILVQGTKTGTVTDVDGNFQLTAPEGCVLRVSYLGMKTKDVKAATNLKIVLQSDNRTLDDVVVTALGVSREKKALGYAVSEVKGSDLIKSRGGVSNPVNALQGKVAGLQISSSSGSMGGSSKIIIRGASSLSGNNQPLFVVDGVPIEGTDYNSTEVGSSDANSTARGAGGYDYGNLVQDINPDDIENISVLKGAAASALYGSRASNGVIMITTKRGQKDQGLGVEYSSTVGFETVTKLPKLQSQYGGGYGYAGDYAYGKEGDDFKTTTVNGTTYTIPDYGMDESWGPKLDGRQVVSWADLQKWEAGGKVGNPTTSSWSPATSDYRDFFKTGVSYTNNVAISKAYDNSAFRISYTNTAMTGYLPNSSQYKNTVSVNGNIMSKDKKLNVFTSVNFFNSRTKGRQDTGYGDNNIMVKFTQWGQRQLNMNELKALYLKDDGTQGSWNRGGFDDPSIQFHNNVYWSRYMNYENDSRNRIYGNVGLSYQILPQLKAQYKANLDFYVDKQYERNAVYSQELSAYKESSRQQYELNHEFMLMYNQAFGDYSVTANLGANIMQRHYELIYGQTQGGLAIPLYYNLANSITTPKAYNYKLEKGINSLFGDVTIGWKSMLFLEATLRGDKSSTLPKSNNTYVYPSVTASWLFSELLKDKAPWLSYGKLRAGYARVGNDTDPYQVLQTYTQYTNIDSSTPGYRLANTLSNSNLKPESTKSWEFGLETSFLNNRLGFDLTYYTTKTSNEILPLSVSGSTGYIYKMINSGTIENKGVEFAFHATPVKTRKFEWTTNITLASNKNTVKSLADGVDYYRISSAPFKVEIGAVVGKPYGVIMGTNYVYDKNGNKCVNSNGLYMSTSGNEDIGHIYPDFTGGWSNSFKWGNFDASFQFDFSKGGHFFSTTQMWGYYCGMFEETAANGVREKGIISDGVVYGTGEKNTVRVSARDYYENYYNGPAAQNILRSDYIKLREVTVGYTFKLNPVWFIKSLRLSAYGRNLGVWGPDCKNFDPEMIVTSSGNIQGIEGGATPMVANYGLTVNLKF